MSITSPDPRISSYAPVVPTTEFAAGFTIFDNADVTVYHNGAKRTDFTVVASYNTSGFATNAKVVFSAGLTGIVLVVGSRSPRRASRFASGGPLPIPDQNRAFDTIEAEVQELNRESERSIKTRYGDPPQTLPPPAAQKILGWSQDGYLLNLDPTQFVNLAGVASAAQGLKADSQPDYADGNLGLAQTRRFINNKLAGAVYDSSLENFDGDAPNFYVVRYAKHTVAANHVPRAFGALTQILADVKNYEMAGEATIEEKVPQTTFVDFVGWKMSYARFETAAGTKASGWGNYTEMHDRTGLRSSLSGGPLRGHEITMIASGLDDGGDDGRGIRYGLDVVHARSPLYSGSDTQFAVGVRVINASRYNPVFGRSRIGTAFDAHGEDPFGTGSTILTALRGWTSEYGVVIDGNPYLGSFVAEIFGSKSIMKLGMKAVSSSAGEIQFTSRNNAGDQKTGVRLDGGLLVSTTGAERGRFSISALVNGVEKEILSYYPSDPVNPWSMDFNGTLRKIIRDPSTAVLTAA